jgi:hypothetical protein
MYTASTANSSQHSERQKNNNIRKKKTQQQYTYKQSQQKGNYNDTESQSLSAYLASNLPTVPRQVQEQSQ